MTDYDKQIDEIFSDLEGDGDTNYALEAMRRLVETVGAERDDIMAVVEDVLTPGDLDPAYAGQAACPQCAWFGCYSQVHGCEPIADTGDYTEPRCPECESEIWDEDTQKGAKGMATAALKRIRAKLDGKPWPELPCVVCGVLVTKETGIFSTDCVNCRHCDEHWTDYMESES